MSLGEREARSPLWFSDGARYGRVEARLTPGGGLEIRRHEMGGGERDVWGEDDHEATLQIAPGEVARLALALLTERYTGRADALEALIALCDAHGVEARHNVWT